MARLCLSVSARTSLWSGVCQQNHLITWRLIMGALFDPCQYCNCPPNNGDQTVHRQAGWLIAWLLESMVSDQMFHWSEILLMVYVFEWLVGEIFDGLNGYKLAVGSVFWWVDFLTDWPFLLIVDGLVDWLAGWITLLLLMTDCMHCDFLLAGRWIDYW